MDESQPLEEIRTWEHPPWYGMDQFKERVILTFLGESDGSLPQPQDSLPDAGEAINDFWSMSGNFTYPPSRLNPRVKLYSPREESFPIPLKYIDVSRTTHTNLDVKQEKRIDDYWNIDGSRDLSDPWTGFTQFTLLEEKPPDGYMWSGWRLTRKQLTSRPDHLWPELWKSMGKHAKLKEKQKWSNEKLHLENARKLRGSISLTLRTRSSKKPSRTRVRSWKHQLLLLCRLKIMKKNCGSDGSNKMKTKLACILEADESTRLRMGNPMPHYHQDHIAGNGEKIHCSTTIWFTNLFLCLKLWKFLQRKQRWTRNGKHWRKFRRGTWRKSEVRKKWSMKQGRRALQFILHR